MLDLQNTPLGKPVEFHVLRIAKEKTAADSAEKPVEMRVAGHGFRFLVAPALEIAYAIGVAHPVSVMVECFGTAKVDPILIEELVRSHFDLRPAAIIRDLDLRRPIYRKTSNYGHFGREDRDFTWERTDRVDALKAAVGA